MTGGSGFLGKSKLNDSYHVITMTMRKDATMS